MQNFMVDGFLGLGEETARVSIDDLVVADSPRLRGLDESHSRMLATLGESLPPVIVHRETMAVIDGMHRVDAARVKGLKEIDVKFFRGSEDDAFQLAVKLNVQHGLPLSRNDRHAAAARILKFRPQQSDRAIAATTGLSTRTIADIRRRTAGAESPHHRVGRDGRARPLNAAVGRRIASETLQSNPDASLRQVARQAGVSVGTVRDVRARLLAGVDPVPSRQLDDEHAESRRATRQMPSPERADREQPSDTYVEMLMDGLRRDPSLRYTEVGRSMLIWLSAGIPRTSSLADLIDRVPPHCGVTIAQIARECAQWWNSFADDMDRLGELS